MPQIAKTCTKPGVAEQLMMLAANYLELAERTLIGGVYLRLL
jgi:hypothetical protein